MAENPFLWSITAADNDDADPAVPWAEGMLPGAVNNSARALMAGVARLLKDLNGTVATTGSANAYLVTPNSDHSTLTNGTLITVRANHTNTAAATLDFKSFGAKAIQVFGLAGEAALAAGQIQSGSTYQLRYDSALNAAAGAWLLLNPTTSEDIGTIKIWPSDTAPTNWLFVDGSVRAQVSYPVLFALIGTTYNTGGEGAGNFRLPDLKGRAPFGSDDMGVGGAAGRITNAESGIVGTTLGASGGAQSVTLTTAQLASHAHTGTTTTTGSSHSHTASSGESGAHTHAGTTGTESIALFPHYSTATQKNANYDPAGGGGVVWQGADVDATGPQLSAHTHSFTTDQASPSVHTHDITVNAGGTHTHTFTSDAAGGGTSHNNMPPALIINFIIKAL